MKQLYVKDSDVRIDGTIEVLAGLAIASSWEADANGVPVPEYAGTTEVWWNDQRTKRDDGGNMMVQGDDGETYSILECELRDDDEHDPRKDCEAGMHSWVNDPSVTGGVCEHCGESYGDPT
jgi:hypothetical protein